MLKATSGTWLNYATTVAMQILFAEHFGASAGAAAFVIAFSLAGALGGIVASTMNTAVIPRLADEFGHIRIGGLRALSLVAVVPVALAGVLAILSRPAAVALATVARVDVPTLGHLLQLAAASAALQIIASGLVAVLVARGSRFIPALAPAFPSTAVVLVLLVAGNHSTVETVYEAFGAGSAVEVVVIAAVSAHRSTVSRTPMPTLARPVALMLGSYVLLSTIMPIDRVLSGIHMTADAVHYDYAMRSLAAVQTLTVGGLMIAGVGYWSGLQTRGQRREAAVSVGGSFMLVAVLLSLAASVAIVAAPDLVRLVFQRGHFTPSDTRAVSSIVVAALPGFVCEGAALVLTQALAGARRNSVLAAVGASHFGLRVILALALAPIWGALGVALAYSLTNVFLLVLLTFLARRYSLFTLAPFARWRALLVVSGTLLAAVILALLAARWPSLLTAGLVLLTFGLLSAALRPLPRVTLLPQ